VTVESRFSDEFQGVRPFKRVIQHRILDPLSLELLSGNFRDGDTITADVEDGKIVFRAEKPVKDASAKQTGSVRTDCLEARKSFP
jgi:ATP-dependent Clp protease ATP-binding subunit ClpA